MEAERLQSTTEGAAVKLVAGGIGIGVGLIDQIVSWAQIISILGGAIIVVITILGMLIRGFKWLKNG